jgi:hypothetical protein
LSTNTTGSNNAAVGTYSMMNNISGSQNTAIGVNSGLTLYSGNYNTFIGYGSDVSAAASTTLFNCTAIGYNSQCTTNNTMVLGNGSINVGIGTTTPATALDVNGDITDESVKSQGCIGTDSTGKIINGTCSGTNYFTNSGATTTLSTGSVLQATIASTSLLCLNGTCQSSFSGGSQTPWTSNINGGGYNLTNVGIASSTQFIMGNGSASSPALAFSASSNTGLYASFSSNSLGISIGGTGEMSITSSVIQPLEDMQGSWGNGSFYIQGGFSPSATHPAYSFQGNNDGLYDPLVSSTGSVGIVVSGSEKARFTTTGLGIGTTTPATALDVNGNVTIEKANGIIMRDTVTGSCYIIKVTSGVLLPTASTTAAC